MPLSWQMLMVWVFVVVAVACMVAANVWCAWREGGGPRVLKFFAIMAGTIAVSGVVAFVLNALNHSLGYTR